jgi:hypothetical protein
VTAPSTISIGRFGASVFGVSDNVMRSVSV